MDDKDRDVQITLRFADGAEQTFTVIRDRGMRWSGSEDHGALVRIEAEWFINPSTPVEEAAE